MRDPSYVKLYRLLSMRLLFLGSGAAFTVGAKNYHSNVILETDNQERLLIDCGADARHSLYEQHLSYQDIRNIYISHLHGDHMGGLEWMGFTHKFDPKCKPPKLFISEALVEDLWNKALSGTMESLEGEISQLNSYFDLVALKENEKFLWEGIKFQMVQTVHVMNGFCLSPCYGLIFRANKTKVYFTADTQFCPQLLMRFYNEADIIFHDCETTPHPSGVHSHFTDLVSLPTEIKNKMWLYHYNHGHLPDAEEQGFLGFVKKGQEFIL